LWLGSGYCGEASRPLLHCGRLASVAGHGADGVAHNFETVLIGDGWRVIDRERALTFAFNALAI